MVCVCARGVYCLCDRWSIGVVCVGHQFMTFEIHECMAQIEYRCCACGSSVHDLIHECMAHSDWHISAKSEVASYRTLHREQQDIFCKKATNLDAREDASKISLY